MTTLTRRLALKLMALVAAWFGNRAHGFDDESEDQSDTIDWSNTPDRVWLDPRIWANPMEDWRVADGAAECQSKSRNRNLQLLTHQLGDRDGPFRMSVMLRRVERSESDAGAGFRVGVRSEIGEYRSNCFAAGGIDAGVEEGQLILGNRRQPVQFEPGQWFRLTLEGTPIGDDETQLVLRLEDAESRPIGSITRRFATDRLAGNVALVNGFESEDSTPASRYRFNAWSIEGSAFSRDDQRRFGPILWSMYTVSDSRTDEGLVLKISALTGPFGQQDSKTVELQIDFGDGWESQGVATLDNDAWTATLRIPEFDADKDRPYRWIYRQRNLDGTETPTEWSGIIKSMPDGRPVRIAALTCQKDYAFPYEPVVNNLRALNPDLLFFAGDQLYEDHGGFGLIRRPAERAILNYLRKYYMFGWAFGDVMRDRPTLCLADDHDVFQGNLWGEGGAAMSRSARGASSDGGYIEPVRMVNAVHRTNTAHHPDLFDSTPAQRGMSVYYGDMVYGGVGFAVVADRQFKSGPGHVDTGPGRADHVVDRDFDMSALDAPGLELLGHRQEEFLRQWSGDWRGHTMKVLLSQTVFAGVATHHGRYDGFLKADLDSGSWPQTARNRALDAAADGRPLHLNGDQHLTTLVQYGVDQPRDRFWSFCAPAIAVGYPRWWRPDESGIPHENRPQHGLPNTGEFLDSFGNHAYVYAVGNPEVGRNRNRYQRAHEKGSGFGLVTVDPAQRTYRVESFRFLVDATNGDPGNQFDGWPVTIHQQENGGDNLLG